MVKVVLQRKFGFHGMSSSSSAWVKKTEKGITMNSTVWPRSTPRTSMFKPIAI